MRSTHSWRASAFFCSFCMFLYFLSNSWRRRVFYFCTFCAFYIFEFLHLLRFFECLYFLYFCTLSFGWTVHMNFHAKSGVCSSKNGWVISTFVLFCTFVLLYFVRTGHTNFHAKSGLCSSKNERVMLNLVSVSYTHLRAHET